QTLHDYELMSASALDARGSRVDRDEARPSYRAINTATFPVRRAVYGPRITLFIGCSRYLAGRYREKRGIDATVLPYFIDPDSRALADATSTLHADEGQWREHSRRAIEGTARLHARDGYIDRLEEVYEGAVASRSPGRARPRRASNTFTTQ